MPQDGKVTIRELANGNIVVIGVSRPKSSLLAKRDAMLARNNLANLPLVDPDNVPPAAEENDGAANISISSSVIQKPQRPKGTGMSDPKKSQRPIGPRSKLFRKYIFKDNSVGLNELQHKRRSVKDIVSDILTPIPIKFDLSWKSVQFVDDLKYYLPYGAANDAFHKWLDIPGASNIRTVVTPIKKISSTGEVVVTGILARFRGTNIDGKTNANNFNPDKDERHNQVTIPMDVCEAIEELGEIEGYSIVDERPSALTAPQEQDQQDPADPGNQVKVIERDVVRGPDGRYQKQDIPKEIRNAKYLRRVRMKKLRSDPTYIGKRGVDHAVVCNFPGCNVKCATLTVFGRHVLEHRGIYPTLPCPYEGCDFKVSSWGKALIKAHVYQVHFGRDPYKCEVCGKGFNRRAPFNKHMREVHDEGEEIEEATGQLIALNADGDLEPAPSTGVVKKYRRKQKYQCEQCGKKFVSNETLKKHKLIHAGIKPFQCAQCGKCFRQANILVVHERTHTGERPLKCKHSDCDFRASHRAGLHAHYKKDHDGHTGGNLSARKSTAATAKGRQRSSGKKSRHLTETEEEDEEDEITTEESDGEQTDQHQQQFQHNQFSAAAVLGQHQISPAVSAAVHQMHQEQSLGYHNQQAQMLYGHNAHGGVGHIGGSPYGTRSSQAAMAAAAVASGSGLASSLTGYQSTVDFAQLMNLQQQQQQLQQQQQQQHQSHHQQQYGGHYSGSH